MTDTLRAFLFFLAGWMGASVIGAYLLSIWFTRRPREGAPGRSRLTNPSGPSPRTASGTTGGGSQELSSQLLAGSNAWTRVP
jgi:hypothetical protein